MKLPMYEVFIDGKPKKIELTKVGDNTFTVRIDGKAVNAELPAEIVDLEKTFTVRIDGKTYHIELPKIDRDKPFSVKVEDATFKAEVKTPTVKSTLTAFEPTPMALAKKTALTKQNVEGSITAPMTGKILSVKVKKGDQVKAGQILCVLEAMKMENEIAASKAGVVQEVYAGEGSSVSEGEPLFVIN